MDWFFDRDAARKHHRIRKYVRALEVERVSHLVDKVLHVKRDAGFTCALCGGDLPFEAQYGFPRAAGDQKLHRGDVAHDKVAQGENNIRLSLDPSFQTVCHECLPSESRPRNGDRPVLPGPVRDADAPFVSEIPAVQPAGRGGSSSLRSAWRAIVAISDRVQDSVIGDMIALASLVAIFFIFILAGVAFG